MAPSQQIDLKDDARVHFQQAVQTLGGDYSAATNFFDESWNTGLLETRFYHTTDHYLDVAQDQEHPFNERDPYRCIRYLTGLHHDIVYQHVDQKTSETGISPAVRQRIESLVNLHFPEQGSSPASASISVSFEPSETLQQGPQKQVKELVIAANRLFEVGADHFPNLPSTSQPLDKFNGQNEYLSALYAIAAGTHLGINPKHILSEICMIAGTVPFKSNRRFDAKSTDAKSLNQMLVDIGNAFEGLKLSDDERMQTLEQTVLVANADVGNFRDTFCDTNQPDFISNSLNLILENLPIQPNPHDMSNVSPLQLVGAINGMEGFMAHVAESPDCNVFHTHDNTACPDEPSANANISKLCHYLNSARNDINLLESHYTYTKGEHPKSLGELNAYAREQLDAWAEGGLGELESAEIAEMATNEPALSAKQLFSILGADALSELSVEMEGSDSLLRTFLMQLKQRARDIRNETRGDLALNDNAPDPETEKKTLEAAETDFLPNISEQAYGAPHYTGSVNSQISTRQKDDIGTNDTPATSFMPHQKDDIQYHGSIKDLADLARQP